MTAHSRRTFLRSASAGAAAVGVAAVVPTASASAAEPDTAGPVHEGAFVVYVRDAKKGEVSVLVGEREIVHRDKALARRLAAIAAQAH